MDTTHDARADLGRAVTAARHLVAAVHDDQWSAPTPCTGWDVRQLLDHLIGGYRTYAALLSGATVPTAEPPDVATTPGAAFDRAASDLEVAFAEPGALTVSLNLGYTTMSGGVAAQVLVGETLVHAWDLARATGQSIETLPADLAEDQLAVSEQALALLPPGEYFDPPQPVDDTAPAINRLAARLGRIVPRT